ncbi:DNA topoisomerase IB [Cytophaga sp. FL35]|uniref:DNA topoisomerase IB n=1 Tax=Cytophaga sp. FL35 TaxID=1904456 RepID=UPI0016539E34|nr:DNA topoisomerase IB [Cytophaga sp. FL35]MBC6998133.1 DNA topoisomerase IB [Cytophaga sp. FL35]
MAVKTLDTKLIKQLIDSPKTAIEHINLVYVTEEHLSIVRKKNKDNFIYLSPKGRLTEEQHIERINSLVIPPAWEEVRITHLENGHLQAIGKDEKKRKQYRYHSLWTKVRNQTKFYRMSFFGKVLPKIRKQVEKDMELRGWPRRKVLALVVKLMEETHIRIGNEQYARRNKSYGLTTLRKKHVDAYRDKLRFHFTGKKGKEHKITLRNKKLIKLVNRCEEIPGWELFKFYDKNGEKQVIDSEMVNDYIKEISGYSFTAKDFRTWAATVVFFDSLLELPPAEEEKQLHKNVLAGFDAAAKALGNTRNVCRKYYVHPLLVKEYEEGSLDRTFEQANKFRNSRHFTSSEKAILKRIEKFNPLEECVS